MHRSPRGKAVRIRVDADPDPGEEKLYVVFSTAPVADLEAIKGLKPLVHESVVIQDPTRLQSLRTLLNSLLDKTQATRDDQAKKAVLSTSQKVLGYRIRFPHQ